MTTSPPPAAPGGTLTYVDLGEIDDFELPDSSSTVRRSEVALAWTDDFDEITWFDPGGVRVIGPDVFGGEVANVPEAFAVCDDTLVVAVDAGDGTTILALDPAGPDVRWSIDLTESAQVVCGTAPVVLVQTGSEVRGLALADGSVAWSTGLDPDDPPNVAGPLFLAGTYDGIVAFDATTGEEAWRVADSESSDAVVATSAYGAVVDLASGVQVIDLEGQIAFVIDRDALDGAVPVSIRDVMIASGREGLRGWWPGRSLFVDRSGVATVDDGLVLGLGPAGAVWGLQFVSDASDDSDDSDASDDSGASDDSDASDDSAWGSVVLLDVDLLPLDRIDVPEFRDVATVARFVLFEHDDGFGLVTLR